jgi:natural product precursor
MKKLELKNLTIKKLSKGELEKTKGGNVPIETSGPCNANSVWPVACTSAAWACSL